MISRSFHSFSQTWTMNGESDRLIFSTMRTLKDEILFFFIDQSSIWLRFVVGRSNRFHRIHRKNERKRWEMLINIEVLSSVSLTQRNFRKWQVVNVQMLVPIREPLTFEEIFFMLCFNKKKKICAFHFEELIINLFVIDLSSYLSMLIFVIEIYYFARKEEKEEQIVFRVRFFSRSTRIYKNKRKS